MQHNLLRQAFDSGLAAVAARPKRMGNVGTVRRTYGLGSDHMGVTRQSRPLLADVRLPPRRNVRDRRS